MWLLIITGILPLVFGNRLLITLNWPNSTNQQQGVGSQFGFQQAGGWQASRLQIQAEGLWTLCRGDRLHVQLGLCSSHFIECSRSGGGGFVVRTCPFKSYVFMNGQCLPAHQFKECHDYVLNVINEETKHLVESESFCANGAGIYRGNNGPHFDQCSRQALICHPNRRDAISLLCLSGQTLTENLECVAAPRTCHSGLEVTAPIREFFLQRACSAGWVGKRPAGAPGNSDLKQYQPESQCASWYVMCQPRPHIIHCGSGEIFDRHQEKCRKWHAGDVCAMSGVCTGREWQSVPIGKCQSQFIYCEGSAGKLYSCGDGMVFDGECKPRETVSECDLCKEGERRPSSSCNEYYECAWKNRALNWQQRKCGSGEAFNDYMKACQKDYTCAAAKTCIHGSSFAVNCRDYMYCTGERYEMFSCPPNTRWDVHAKTCVMDPTCEMSSYPSPNSCLNGDAVPSADCVTYQICLNSTYYSAPCRDDFGYPAVACSHCFSSADTYPVDQLTFPGQCSSQDRLPHPQDCAAYYTCVGKSWSYRRCEKSGTIYDSVTKTCIQATSWQCSSSTQVQCRHGERIIHRDPSMCDRLTECRHGSWVDLQCPAGYIYDAKTFNCVRGQCQGVQQYPQVLPPPQPVAGSPQVAPPASNQNGPVAAQSSIYGVPNFVSPSCHGSLRAPDQYDCSRFWECGSSGTFHSMTCPIGSVYDTRKKICMQGTCSSAKCVERSFQPTEECGVYK
ncbi:hypothetical protein Y032_0056g2679 [Ancylostoma ceylanicum]|uniref:Chitin-binding type-2 domain-containing protein n=2 Tax=Ancylostoma ceylanicum TaxID=53326 RepID=A0A016U647_9BILA|nr:hypothetical protein Y032_0056g2679 [Ancylostoma ceylanicum]